NDSSRNSRLRSIERDLAGPSPSAFWTNSAQAAPTTSWTSIASTARTHHEIACREAIDCSRGTQDQCQSRRSILEWPEGDFGTSEHGAVRTGRRERQQSPARQPVFRDQALRPGLLPFARHPRNVGYQTARLMEPPSQQGTLLCATELIHGLLPRTLPELRDHHSCRRVPCLRSVSIFKQPSIVARAVNGFWLNQFVSGFAYLSPCGSFAKGAGRPRFDKNA